MTRPAAAATAVAAVAGAAVLLGGRTGLLAGTLAVVTLVLGLFLGSPWFVTAGPVIVGGAYLAPLVLFGGRVDAGAPLLAIVLFTALEAGHLSLEGDRYDLPGGRRLLARRLAYLAVIAVAGYLAGWAALLTGRPIPLPALAGTVLGGLAAVAVMVLLRVLRPSADVDVDRPTV